ncbi:uncharacterized protein LOC125650007 [Ostrea edulis]|uniref:uncharacterized protein LOC125650007 n=1 Tax=Ostrea edulis TaxID=37623 RepID=UPI0024AF817C|nr:uncharacterized protein LOC125650007 [Ostrea edulis]
MRYLWNTILVVLQAYHCSSCPNDTGWIGNPDWTFCYKDMNDVEDFVTSANVCSAINTTMAMPKNDTEVQQLITFMTMIGKKSAWIYLAKSGFVFQWMDGMALTEESWADPEPSGDGNCVEVSTALLGWNDLSCTQDKRNTICQALNEITPITELVKITTPTEEMTTTDLPINNTTTSTLSTSTTTTSAVSTSTTTSALFNSTTTTSALFNSTIYNTTEVNLTCYTYTVCGANRTLSVWELATLIAKRQADLTVEKSRLSSTIRRKSSAGDTRPSSVSIGVLGGIVIVIIYMFISFLDLVPVKAKPKTSTKPKNRSKSAHHRLEL